MKSRTQIRALTRLLDRKFTDLKKQINMHAFGFSLALVSSLLVADVKRFPSGDGQLDRAIKLALERGAFSPWKEWLAFAETPAGLRCVQLQEALLTAQMAGIIWFPGPTYNEAEATISADAARKMLRNNKVDEETAREWGRALVEALSAGPST